MTVMPTAEDHAESQRQMDEITILAGNQRIALLERLIEKYAQHVGNCEGVCYLEDHYRDAWGPNGQWTDEEWTEIRRIAGETE